MLNPNIQLEAEMSHSTPTRPLSTTPRRSVPLVLHRLRRVALIAADQSELQHLRRKARAGEKEPPEYLS